MRIIRTLCAPALLLAIPALIAFQVAARPMVSCGQDACKLLATIMPCMVSDDASVDTEPSGCCARKAPEPTGRCQSMDTEPSCSGCSKGKATQPECAKKSNTPVESKSPQCPDGLPLCGLCPLVPVAAEPAAKVRAPEIRIQELTASHGPLIFSQTDSSRWDFQSHAPPLTAMARAGPDRRIEFCSYLL